jgi:septal ring factor EnvC (AmiA/AmiB activator)
VAGLALGAAIIAPLVVAQETTPPAEPVATDTAPTTESPLAETLPDPEAAPPADTPPATETPAEPPAATEPAPTGTTPAEANPPPADTAPSPTPLEQAQMTAEQAQAEIDKAAAAQAALESQQQLEDIEASISVSTDRAEELKLEIEEMRGDRARQNAALIAAGQRVKLAETDIAALEQRLDDLIVAEMEVRGRLDGADTNISNVLAALERISRSPPPALIVDPSDALGSARSALLISAILPQLEATAAQVTEDLTRLTDIKAAALAEETQLRANFAILEEEQLRIATLIVARKQGETIITAELAEEEAEAIALAARAATLKDLIASLTERANAVVVAPNPPEIGTTGATPLNPDAASVQIALADTARTTPAVPFPQVKGHLTLPSSGVKIIDYGGADGFGGIAHGISVITRAEAQVVAPADGTVLFAGDYLNYGQIIILNPGDDYTILLAGLDKVSVEIGQFVLMGEPVGVMGSRTIGQAVTTSAGVASPTLYIEMRKNNEPVDPTEWWTSSTPLTTPTPTQSG